MQNRILPLISSQNPTAPRVCGEIPLQNIPEKIAERKLPQPGIKYLDRCKLHFTFLNIPPVCNYVTIIPGAGKYGTTRRLQLAAGRDNFEMVLAPLMAPSTSMVWGEIIIVTAPSLETAVHRSDLASAPAPRHRPEIRLSGGPAVRERLCRVSP